jgi:heterodisulfide reductase subunit B2
MTVAYYPGCSLHGTSREYDESMRAVASALGIELAEIDDWSCCGASSAHSTNHLLGVALPARNLALAEEAGHESVLAPCAMCYSRLAITRHEIENDDDLAEQIPQIIERPFANSVDVVNVVQLLLERAEQIREGVSARNGDGTISQLKVAAYYGCLLVRPVEVGGADDTEVPTTMEQVISACGATPVSWNMAVECCGGSFSMTRSSSVLRLGRAILDDARKAGADAVVVACPMCHSNLDFRQVVRGERDGAIPILYLTEVVGLALGLDAETLGLNRHFVDVQPLLAKLSERAQAHKAADAEAAKQRAARAAAASASAAGAADAATETTQDGAVV